MKRVVTVLSPIMGTKRKKKGEILPLSQNRFESLSEESSNTFSYSDYLFPSLPASSSTNDNKPRYVVISTNGTSCSKPIGSYNPFVVKKSIEAISKKILSIKEMRSGDLLVAVANKTVAQRFFSVNKLGDVNVKITSHTHLNSVQGRIFSRKIIDLDESYLLEQLKDENVIEVKKLKKKIGDNYVYSGAAILKFDLVERPKYIHIGWEQTTVKEHIPNPMRCQTCQMIGHTKKHCKNAETPICRDCGKTQHEEKCESKFCVNCKVDTHPSYDTECEEFRKAKSILKIRNENRCTSYEAKRIFYSSPQLYLIPARDSNKIKKYSETIKINPTNKNENLIIHQNKTLSSTITTNQQPTIPPNTIQTDEEELSSINSATEISQQLISSPSPLPNLNNSEHQIINQH